MAVNIGFILTRTPDEVETTYFLLEAASIYLDKGDRVTVFLLGDSVWLANKSRPVYETFAKKGCKIVVSGEHLKASGLSRDQILPAAEVATDTYDSLVELVMEKFDKVVIV